MRKSLREISKILGLLVEPLIVYDKYSLLHRGNLLEHFQMQLCQKQKTFSEFFFAFSKFRLNFEHFQKKDYAPSACILGLTNSEKHG